MDSVGTILTRLFSGHPADFPKKIIVLRFSRDVFCILVYSMRFGRVLAGSFPPFLFLFLFGAVLLFFYLAFFNQLRAERHDPESSRSIFFHVTFRRTIDVTSNLQLAEAVKLNVVNFHRAPRIPININSCIFFHPCYSIGKRLSTCGKPTPEAWASAPSAQRPAQQDFLTETCYFTWYRCRLSFSIARRLRR